MTTPLTNLSLEQLREFAESLGEKPYRGAQLFGWIHQKGATSFEEMSDISLGFREMLHKTSTLRTMELVHDAVSSDGTRKFAFRLHDGPTIESVLIPAENDDQRLTLCVSTQVGCPLDCAFCATGTMGFTRNLSAGEILEQYLIARTHSPKRISNVVYMGMGEPMLNYEQVMRSADVLMDARGMGIGSKHITISTAGYADSIRRMADERRRMRLALSLHSLDQRVRTQLMPITKKFSIDDLVEALQYYYAGTKQRPTIEYILFDGVNDSTRDAELLVRLSRAVPCKVNLIPFHSIAFTAPRGFASTLKPSSAERIEWFAQKLRDAFVTVMVRSSSGVDINAACGQLAASLEASR